MKFIKEKTIFVIDGSSFLYRAYYGLKPMHTSSGQTIQAVYGFCRMILKLIKQFDPKNIAVVWDSPQKTVRHELFQEYKATRQAPPSDLFEQKKMIQEYADIIGLKQVQVAGIEADDLMYSIAQDFHLHGYTTVFITSDKDMRQAVTEDIVIFDPFKDIFLTQTLLEEKYGFPLSKLVFYFALIGDTSDNIPGVRGIGPKGAHDLVVQFDSLEQLYARIDTVSKERTRELLQAAQDNALLSEQLFALRYYSLHLKRDDFLFNRDTIFNARAFFEKLEFKSLLKDFPAHEQVQLPLSEKKNYSFEVVTTHEQLNKLCALIATHKVCSIDTETDGLDPLQARIVGISLCVQVGTAFYIPIDHKNSGPQLEKNVVMQALKPLFLDMSIKKYFHHAKFDQLVIYKAGAEVHNIVFDTLVAASLVTQDWQRIGLKYLSRSFLNEEMIFFDDIVKKKGYKNFAEVPYDQAVEYAAADAHQTFQLVPLLHSELKKYEQEALFYDIELPLVQILYAMEKEGIMLDGAVLNVIDQEATSKLQEIRTMIINLIGPDYADINLNSPKQLEELLFVALGLTPTRKTTQRTSYSTDYEVLQELAKVHIIPGLIIQYRELFKLKSTYIDALPTYINASTGKIHTSFSQTKTATGRLASSDPNLQNIPVHSPTRIQIRSAFKPPLGSVFLSADYSQIELRVLAYVSQDATLVRAFLEGQDVHVKTASGLFDVPVADVTPEQRQVAKRINFSILYGLTPYGLAKDLDIPFTTAKIYIEKYFEQYPGVVTWMERVVAETKDKGYVTTLWGRRRYLPGIYEKNKSLYELARRMAINTVGQGTAAEIMKLGMLALDKQLAEQYPDVKMVLQIHDELLLSVPEHMATEIELLVKQTLENVVQWNIPLIVTTRIGNDWNQVSK
ncbi:MAG: DNA polymerase I [Candidatus Babeliaceae bacterium]|jgi:DNA polymerase-1